MVRWIFVMALIFTFQQTWLLNAAQINLSNHNTGWNFNLWPGTGNNKCRNATQEIPCPKPGEAYYGQDAQYPGSRSYTKLGYGGVALPNTATQWEMVRDDVTGLVWEVKNSEDWSENYSNPSDSDNDYSWCDTNPESNGGYPGICGANSTMSFIAALNEQHHGGFSDWRMPTVKELATLLVFDQTVTPLPIFDKKYFPSQKDQYLTSTSSDKYWYDSTTYAYPVYYLFFGGTYGFISSVNKKQYYSLPNYFRPAMAVRGNNPNTSILINNNNGTITDTGTKLMWQQDTAEPAIDPEYPYNAQSRRNYNWSKALAYCENLTLAGYDDWRLPNFHELHSIVDYSLDNPSINLSFFYHYCSYTDCDGDYWTSTVLPDASCGGSSAQQIDFQSGGASRQCAAFQETPNSGELESKGNVRCVRNISYGLLSVSPASQKVAINEGSTTFSVSLVGGSEPAVWTAQVISGASWLSITTGVTGITCNFSANTGAATLPRTAKIRVTSTGATGSPTDVTVTQVGSSTRTLTSSFAGAGIWSYSLGSASWTQISATTPENLIYSGSQLYGDFGASGIWQWNGAAWSQIAAANPENMLVSGSTLYGDFGVYGIYSRNGTSWNQLAAANPENLLVSGSNLYGDFGASGIYLWDGTKWNQLTSANPENLLISGINLYGDFGASGIWKWNNTGTAWTKLGTLNPENLLINDSTICGDFGAAGVWKWTGTGMVWTQLATANPENLYFSNSTLYGDFGAAGVWKWTGTEMVWTNLATTNSENLLISNPAIYGDFGASGLWQWEDGSWYNLSKANPLKMLLSN